jgi:hypothetical protein
MRFEGTRILRALVALFVAGAVLALTRRRRSRAPFMTVRDAGPDNMEFAPSEWDRVDEAADQSFPASDPPCHCIRSRA